MDNLLFLTPSKKSHMDKLEDLLKVLLKKQLEDFSKEMPIVSNKLTVYG